MLLNQIYQSWKQLLRRHGRPAPRRNARRGSVPTEALEQRVVFSGNPINAGPSGIVTISGDSRIAQSVVISNGQAPGSSIHVSYRGSDGRSFETDYSNVTKVVFHGSDQGDYFENQTHILTNVFANGGIDTLIGGTNIDELHGGTGDDEIYGRGGHDQLYGDAGNDRIDGGAENDALYGGDGNDMLTGNDGDDRLFGENGNDELSGGAGRDTLNGGSGMNILSQESPSLVSIGNVMSAEGNNGTTTFTFQVNLTLGDSDSLPVEIQYATVNGTATAGSDYTAVSGTKRLQSGSNIIQVTVRGDTNRNEPNENFFLKINSATNAIIVDGQGLGTILDDDNGPVPPVPGGGGTGGGSGGGGGSTTLPQISINDVSLKEGNSGQKDFVFTIDVVAGSNPNAPITATYSTSSGTALAGPDFVAAAGVLNLVPGLNTLTIKVKGDTTQEQTETFFVELFSANARVLDGQGKGTILADDFPKTKVSVTSEMIVDERPENGTTPNTVQFRVTLDRPAERRFTLPYATANGSAVAWEDYVPVSGFLTFAIGETEKIVTVQIVDDVEIEIGESFSFNVFPAGFHQIASDYQNYPERAFARNSVTIVSDEYALEWATPGVYRDGTWYLDLNGDGFLEEQKISFGLPGDQAVVGDWDGNGTKTPGVFRDGQWYLDIAGDGFNGEKPIAFGLKGDKAVVGDWDNDGKDNIGIFRDGLFILDVGQAGYQASDLHLSFGLAGDTPVAGDWDGDGKDTVGVVRGRDWYLDRNGNGFDGETSVGFGLVGDRPVVGDWNGDGKDDMGMVRGDNKWYFDFDGQGGRAERSVQFGLPGDTPVAGTWRPRWRI